MVITPLTAVIIGKKVRGLTLDPPVVTVENAEDVARQYGIDMDDVMREVGAATIAMNNYHRYSHGHVIGVVRRDMGTWRE